MHFWSNEDKEKWIEDYVDRETTSARKRVEDAETTIMQGQAGMSNPEKEWSTTRKPEKSFEEMLNAIGDSLSNLTSSGYYEDGEDEEDEEDTEIAKLSEDDEPGWVMGTISKMVLHRMESFRQKQMRLDELPQPGCGDAADSCQERDMKYGTAGLMVPAIVKPQTETTAATPLLTTFGELMETLDIVPGQSQIPQGTSWSECSQMRLGLEKPQSHRDKESFFPDAVSNSLPIENVNAVERVTFDPAYRVPS